MFAYCNNNVVNCYDSDGKDAIWIHEKDSANGAGHPGLLVQDEDGNWWYFYWGPIDPTVNVLEMCLATPEICFYEQIDVGDCDMHNAEEINDLIQSLDVPSGTITSIIYYEGDYTPTHYYLQLNDTMADVIPVDAYSLLLNNCDQVSTKAMSISNGMFDTFPSLIPKATYYFLEIADAIHDLLYGGD